MKKLIDALAFFLMVFVLFTASAFIMWTNTKITAEKVVVERIDYPFATTEYRILPGGEEQVFKTRLFSKSTLIYYDRNKGGIYKISSRGWFFDFAGENAYSIERKPDSYYTVSGVHYMLAPQLLSAALNEAEKILRDTRKRFAPLIQKKLGD